MGRVYNMEPECLGSSSRMHLTLGRSLDASIVLHLQKKYDQV